MIPLNRIKMKPPQDYRPPVAANYNDTLLEKTGHYNFLDIDINRNAAPTLDDFITHVEERIELHRPHSVIFRHAFEYIDYDDSFDVSVGTKKVYTVNKQVTFNIARNQGRTFRQYIDHILEMRLKDIFGEDYDTYDKLEIIGESINVSRARLLIPKAGHGSDDVGGEAYDVRIGDTVYLLQSVSSGSKTCFFDTLKEFFTDEVVDALHEDMGCDGISEDYLVDCDAVLQSYHIMIQTPNVTVGSGLLVEMCLDGGHWCKVISRMPMRIKKQDNAHLIVAYDYETVSDLPYMFSICSDEGSHCIWTEKPGDPLFNRRIADLLEPYIERGYTFIGFNSSRYDDLYLLDVLDFNDWIIMKGNGNSILTMRHAKSGATFMDVCRFLKMSLANACKMLDIERAKLELDHDAVTDQFMQDAYVKVTPEMIDYSCRDTQCLIDIWLRAKALFRTEFGLNATGCISLSQMVMRGFTKHNGKGVPQITPSTPHYEYSEGFREFLTGGKCHALKGIHVRPKIYVYDVNSLYPFVMMTETFISAAKNWRRDKHVVWHGVYKVVVTKTPPVCIIPLRGEVLDWDPQAPYGAFCSGIDLMEHLGCGGRATVLDGFSYEEIETSDTMFDFLKDYYRIKQTSTGPVKNLAKLLMNSLSGKMSQKAITTETRISRGSPIVEDHEICGAYYFNNIKKDEPTTTGSFINAVLIYSYARRVLNKHLRSCGERFYCDTDSVFCTNPLPVSDELGAMKLEAVGDTLYVGGKKMYTLYSEGTVVKSALKGAMQQAYFNDDTVASGSDTWLKRAMDSGLREFVVTSMQCVRKNLGPKFKSVPRKITLEA